MVVVYSAFCLIMVVISSLMDNYILGGIAFAETDAVKICKTYSPMISIHSLITEADLTGSMWQDRQWLFQSTASSQRPTKYGHVSNISEQFQSTASSQRPTQDLR